MLDVSAHYVTSLMTNTLLVDSYFLLMIPRGVYLFLFLVFPIWVTWSWVVDVAF